MMQKDSKSETPVSKESEAVAEDSVRQEEGKNAAEAVADAKASEADGSENATDADKPADSEKKLAKELEDMKQRYFRALADYQNLQRRTAKEVLEARGRGVEDFLKNLLPVLDTLDKAMEQIGKSNIDKKIIDGLEMFSIQFSDMLAKEGLKDISPLGQKFDPHFHEAMCKRTLEDQDDETVLNVFVKGYMFKERVLRTAQVEINQK
ncbi:MAG: nucleotide exchange factor GrpE [Candidatus Riflebacteria bacterium HGW-Riflebacteria-2]|jgi:molecular chaperone GrpE|nr:MAG: nucleotide exchange factor GrpE [Candidatus Riflebacteria bacterium HGW-Riflebacteria-2]